MCTRVNTSQDCTTLPSVFTDQPSKLTSFWAFRYVFVGRNIPVFLQCVQILELQDCSAMQYFTQDQTMSEICLTVAPSHTLKQQQNANNVLFSCYKLLPFRLQYLMYKMAKVKKKIQPTVHNSCYLAYLDHQG